MFYRCFIDGGIDMSIDMKNNGYVDLEGLGALVLIIILIVIVMALYSTYRTTKSLDIDDINNSYDLIEMIEKCELELPRNQKCILIAVPELKKED
jgi:hypothetical protein